MDTGVDGVDILAVADPDMALEGVTGDLVVDEDGVDDDKGDLFRDNVTWTQHHIVVGRMNQSLYGVYIINRDSRKFNLHIIPLSKNTNNRTSEIKIRQVDGVNHLQALPASLRVFEEEM